MFGIEMGKLLPQAIARPRDQPDAAPSPVGHLEDSPDDRLGGLITVMRDRTGVGVAHFAPPCFQFLHAVQHAVQDVDRLEAGHNDWDVVLGRQRLILPVTHHGADVSRGQEAIHLHIRRVHQGSNGSRDSDMRDQHGKVGQSPGLGLQHCHGIGRGCRLEADRKENDGFIRVIFGDLERIQRRVNNANIPTGGFDGKQVPG